jgi:multiple sugar transport system substrate-binding protein
MKGNMHKKQVSVIIVMILVISLIVGCGSTTKTDSSDTNSNSTASETGSTGGDKQGTVTMWGWDEGTIKNVSAAFNQKFPDIKIQYIPVSSGDYTKKIQASVTSGMELPDILWQDFKQRGIQYQMDIWEDLTKAPYNYDTSKVFDYCVQSTSASDGRILGVEWFLNATGLTYRKAPAKEYIGTDDPKELEAKIKSWDDFIEIGKQVKEKSKGTVYMFASVEDAMAMISGNFFESEPEIFDKDNKMDLEGTYGVAFDTLIKMRDAGIIDKLTAGSPAANAAMAEDNHIFYPGATWSPHYNIEANDPDSKDKWSLMVSPGVAFNWGGTAMGITKTSTNKELAWEFIQWSLLTKEGAIANRDSSSYLTNLKSVYDDPSYIDFKIPCYGTLNAGDIWANKITPNIKSSPISKYDALLDEIGRSACQALMKDSKLNKEQVLEKMKNEITSKAPELK